jgi:nucleotide-binding universal stress UspA family protein
MVQALVVLFNGFPHTGALARTATNIKVGALSPLAGVFKFALKLALAMFLAKWLELVPMDCIAGILLFAASNMVKPAEVREVWRHNNLHAFLMIYTAVMVPLTDFSSASCRRWPFTPSSTSSWKRPPSRSTRPSRNKAAPRALKPSASRRELRATAVDREEILHSGESSRLEARDEKAIANTCPGIAEGKSRKDNTKGALVQRPQVMSFHRVVVALALAEGDAALLRYARLLAGLGFQEFIFVHVQPPAAKSAGPAAIAAEAKALEERMALEVHEHFAVGDAAAVSHVCRLLQGVRLDALSQLVGEKQADLVLLGHRRARSGQRSLARRLAMVAPCSIWLAPEGTPAQLSSILVPTDFSEHSADALSTATEVAARRGLGECTALHVYFDPSSVRYDEHIEEVLGDEAAKFDAFMKLVDRHGVHVEPLFVESTRPAEEILRTAGRLGADLIVMNTRGRSRAAAILLGSVTSEVMRQTTVPILVVKHYGAKLGLLQALFDQRTWQSGPTKTN